MRRGRCGRIGRAIAPVLASLAVLVGTGCLYGPDPHITFTEMVNRGKPGSGHEWEGLKPWFCVSKGAGGSHGHAGDGLADDYYAGKVKGELSWEDCATVADFLDKAWASVSRYPTRGDALAANGGQAVQFVPGLGTHDIVPGLSAIQTDAPDPAHPFFLQYDGEGPDAPLAGMSWFVIRGEAGPPTGLPGDNDWWHQHKTLCFKNGTRGTVLGNEISDEECARRGGTNRPLPSAWMLHAWIVPGYEDQYDVFSGAYNCVRGTGPYAPTEDPCRTDLSDPEHGHGGGSTPPSTDAHGHTDDDHAHLTTTTGLVPPPPAGATTTTTVTTMPPMDHGAHDH
jgi:hypothetical protein